MSGKKKEEQQVELEIEVGGQWAINVGHQTRIHAVNTEKGFEYVMTVGLRITEYILTVGLCIMENVLTVGLCTLEYVLTIGLGNRKYVMKIGLAVVNIEKVIGPCSTMKIGIEMDVKKDKGNSWKKTR